MPSFVVTRRSPTSLTLIEPERRDGRRGRFALLSWCDSSWRERYFAQCRKRNRQFCSTCRCPSVSAAARTLEPARKHVAGVASTRPAFTGGWQGASIHHGGGWLHILSCRQTQDRTQIVCHGFKAANLFSSDVPADEWRTNEAAHEAASARVNRLSRCRANR